MSEAAASFGFRDVPAGVKPAMVKDVFDRVARRYDLMNDLMSGGAHRLWKDAAAARVNPQPGETILDCAGGTGDMAARLVRLQQRARQRRGGAEGRILVVDFNPRMIAVGRGRAGSQAVEWAAGDAQCLPLADGAVDAVAIAFGLRNVADVGSALKEMRRVLKAGGRCCCLEFSRPVTAALRRAYDAYSFGVLPALGSVVARDRDAYRYLVESIRRFPDQARLKAMMEAAGFARVVVTNFSGGVCALHHGWAL